MYPTDGNKVTLYQDAYTHEHYTDEVLPVFRGPKNKAYKTYDCFGDIYDAIKRAEKFIYVMAWGFQGFPDDLSLIHI